MFQIYQVLALPATPAPSSIYFVSTTTAGAPAEAYITDVNGDPRQMGNTAFVQTLIDAAFNSMSTFEIVADIAARDALTNANNKLVLVNDASADGTVDSGAAMYSFDFSTSTYNKIAEFESLDVELAWASITGGPVSSPAMIDAAVTATHTHANKAVIDLFTENATDTSVPEYRGNAITTWPTTDW